MMGGLGRALENNRHFYTTVKVKRVKAIVDATARPHLPLASCSMMWQKPQVQFGHIKRAVEGSIPWILDRD